MADEDNDAQLMAEVTRRGDEVRGLLTKKDKKAALAKALESPPIAAKSAQVKVCICYVILCMVCLCEGYRGPLFCTS
jgi:hypothetical protein